MPVVPKSQLQVEMTSNPKVEMDAPLMTDHSQKQVAQLGAATQNLVTQVGKAAEQMQGKPNQMRAQNIIAMARQMHEEANQTRVQDAINRATLAGLELTHGENGYSQIKGEAAMRRPDGKPLGIEFAGNLNKVFTDIEGTLGNSAQKAGFQQWASQYQNKFNEGAFKHEVNEAIAYEASVLRATVGTQEQVLAHNWDKPEVVEGALGSMIPAFEKMQKMQGKSDEEVEGLRPGFISHVHQYVVTQALQNENPEYAQAYVEQYSSQMTPEVLGTVQKAVAQEVNIKVAKNVTDSLFAANPDMDEQQMLQAAAAMPEIAEHPHDMERQERMELVKTDIIGKQRAKAKQERELRETSMVQVQKALQERGGNWLALPPAVRSALPKGIEPYAKAYAKSLVKPVKVSNADAYLHLNDVKALTGMSDANFEMMRTLLNEEDFDFYATQRAAYKEAQATGKGVQKMPAVLNLVEVNKQMDGILSMLKIKTKPEEMSKFEKAKVSAIRKVFNKHLLESQMAEGKSYSKDEIANKLSEFVAEQVLKRSDSAGGFGAGKTAVKRDIFTVQASDISPVDIDRARNELARHGEHNSTDEQVTQAILERGEFQAQGARASDDASGRAGSHYSDSDDRGDNYFGESAVDFSVLNQHSRDPRDGMITPILGNNGLYNASYGQPVGGLTASANSTIVAGDDPLRSKFELPRELREASENFNRKLNPLYFIVDLAKAGFIGYRRRQERRKNYSEKVYAPENITPEVQEDYLEIIKLLYPETKDGQFNPQNVDVNVVKAVDSILDDIHECSGGYLMPHVLFTLLYSPPSTPLEIALTVGQAESTGTFREWADVLREDQVYIACKNSVLSAKKHQIFAK